jgi:toxin ParE1/3/4
MRPKAWRVRLGATAEDDFIRILDYTRKPFGSKQAASYRTTLLDALATLEAGPEVRGSLARPELFRDVRSLHVARKGRRGRHFIIFRPVGEDVVEVLRILHDAMDLVRHVPGPID